MFPIGKFRFAMIAGKRLSQSPHFQPADRRFQNGRRVNKMAARCFQAWIPRFRAGVSNCGPPDVLGLQLPEILASRGGGEGFWEL